MMPPVAQPPTPIADIYPLSPMQQGMLFHSLLAPQSGAYVVQVCFELHEPLAVDRFEQAWQQVVDRHPILRTAFAWEQLEQPLQVVGHSVKLPLQQLDWQSLTAAEQPIQQRALLQQQRIQGFQLNRAPLMRLTLIQKQPSVYTVIWSYHHLLLDGWSVPLLLQEVLACYRGLDLPPAYPYRHYIAWLQQQDQQQAEQFWRQTLQGFLTPTPFGIDRVANRITEQIAPAIHPAIYQEQQLQLSPQLTARLRSFTQQQQLTLNTLVQAAYALLLSRYSGATDVVFGVTCAGRPVDLPQAEAMIGLFINTLPMRIKLAPQQPILPWLRQIQLQQLDLRQYEYSSLIDIHRWSDIPRSLPLFESLLIFENYPINPDLKSAIASLKSIQTSEQTNYPLSLYVVNDAAITLRILYDSERFSAESITRMLNHLEILLDQLTVNPNQHLGELNILTKAEQQQIAQWNATEQVLTEPNLIHELFETQVEQTPDAIALVFEDQQFSYEILNQIVNQLAHYLLTLNVTSGAPIGLYLNRSPAMLIALLAVLKAGTAYLPLDPAFPAERLQWMLQTAQTTVLLTDSSLPSLAADSTADLTICHLDQFQPAAYPTTNPSRVIHPNQLAYLLYTSGSTGQPKAVQILHKAVVNFLRSMQLAPGLTSDDTLLAVTTLSFDIAALELLLPLTVGAKLVIAPQNLDPQLLINQLDRHSISILQATPATWRLLLLGGWSGHAHLKALCGGEALDADLAAQLLERVQQLWNLYGPTETTIWSAVQQITPSDATTGSIPIGRPIANTQFHVLDAQLQPVPIGVIGELYISGIGLAQSYRERPDLTAERFIPNPFASASRLDFRLYKTGDRVRYRPDGTLDYLGRSDYQIKLRGFRIELSEIEATLMRHPIVQQAIVQLHQDRLIAYVTLTETLTETTAPVPPLETSLRHFLSNQLPSYMLPSSFVPLESFPLTTNGKINRQALPDPHPTPTAPHAPPQTSIEQTIAQIWQQILKLEQISIHDNFFDLGGHSLLLVQAHSQLRAHYPNLPLLDLFRYPTISSLAIHLSQPTPTSPPSQSPQQLQAGKARQQQRRQRVGSQEPEVSHQP
ncbi:amino acid adenylation domain-containing protein [Leptolyngbya sp. NK1-12]|nr:amino acid adenylation domain-containing protein [Leptolyngbya sp. NK1-12]